MFLVMLIGSKKICTHFTNHMIIKFVTLVLVIIVQCQ